MRVKLSSENIRQLLDIDPLDLPKYTSQIMNLANQNAQGTRPRVVGQLSELIKEFDGRTVEEWEKWYLARYGDKLDEARNRIRKMIHNLQEAIHLIDDEVINRWVNDLVIVKTFIGLRYQQAILAEIANRLDLDYRLAESDEESKGIDGFIGKTPVSIKPITYKTMNRLQEGMPSVIIYYEKVKNDLTIEFDEKEIR